MIKENMLNTLREEVRARMGEKRFRHTLGVEKEMRSLAKIYMPLKETEAACAGLLHDVTKELSLDEHISLLQRYSVTVLDAEINSASLLHAKTGAFYAKENYPTLVSDEMFSAIWKHTTAAEEMSLFDKLLYLADFIEEGRTYFSCTSLRKEFYSEIQNRLDDKLVFLNEMMIKAYDASLSALRREGLYISANTVLAREAAIKERFALEGKK